MPENETGAALDQKRRPLYKQRYFQVIALLLAMIVLGGGIFALFLLQNPAESDGEAEGRVSPSPGTVNGNQTPEPVTVLPQSQRIQDQSEPRSRVYDEPSIDPFADPLVLSGIVIGGRGGAMAIVESGGIAYVVGEGDYIDDLWLVRRVSADSVILRAYSRELTLFLDRPPLTRSLDPGRDPANGEEAD